MQKWLQNGTKFNQRLIPNLILFAKSFLDRCRMAFGQFVACFLSKRIKTQHTRLCSCSFFRLMKSYCTNACTMIQTTCDDLYLYSVSIVFVNSLLAPNMCQLATTAVLASSIWHCPNNEIVSKPMLQMTRSCFEVVTLRCSNVVSKTHPKSYQNILNRASETKSEQWFKNYSQICVFKV